jgi:hypothetical protein
VIRYNQEGVEGLRDRPKPGRPPTLTDGEQALQRSSSRMILRRACWRSLNIGLPAGR